MKLQISNFFSFLTLVIFIRLASSQFDERFLNCSQAFNCGGINNLKYPFYGGNRASYCGHSGFELHCLATDDDDVQFPAIIISFQTSRIIKINTKTHKITVARNDYWDNICPSLPINTNTSIDSSLFEYAVRPNRYLTFVYDCISSYKPSIGAEFPGNSSCYSNGSQVDVFFRDGSLFNDKNIGCTTVINIPIQKSLASGQGLNKSDVLEALRVGFELKWKANDDECKSCEDSGGQCGNIDMVLCQNEFMCYYDHQQNYTCFSQSDGGTLTNSQIKILLLALISASVICISIITALGLYFKGNYSYKKWQDVEVLLRKHGSPGPKSYTYSDLKKITSSFKDKLGEGGFGVVYRGKLHDGHQVAVKLLKKSSKEDMEEFINEVASIGKTNHVNIVKLVGFCYEGGEKRALVYNYLPNGSLEKFTYGGQKNHQPLSLEKLFEIAVGIARGLEYLHRGCDTRILHFDIKPQNILLDENFCPKISDFGLAKLCLQKESIISMSEARGTVGYIAPEVFFKRIGGVSCKSDVYSYGMLVLEMVGCRNNADVGVEGNSEQYFSDWIQKQLEQVEELNANQEGILNCEEGSLRRKLVLVSLWCIQTNPMNRPYMTRVVEMLEGDLESLQIPPIPSLASPLISDENSSTISTDRLLQEPNNSN